MTEAGAHPGQAGASADGSTSGQEADERARRSAEVMLASDEASRALGIELVEVGPSRARMRMRVTETMVNGHDIAHAVAAASQIVVRGSARTDSETKIRWKLSPAGASGEPT